MELHSKLLEAVQTFSKGFQPPKQEVTSVLRFIGYGNAHESEDAYRYRL